MLAADLVGRVAEDPLGREVERFQPAVLVDGDDPLGGGIEDGADAGLALPQFAGPAADVLDHPPEGPGQSVPISSRPLVAAQRVAEQFDLGLVAGGDLFGVGGHPPQRAR